MDVGPAVWETLFSLAINTTAFNPYIDQGKFLLSLYFLKVNSFECDFTDDCAPMASRRVESLSALANSLSRKPGVLFDNSYDRS